MAAFANFKLVTTDTSIDTFLKVRPMGNVRKLFGLITDTGNATKGVTTCIAPFASNFIVEHVLVRVCILVHAYLRALIVDRAAAYRCMRSSKRVYEAPRFDIRIRKRGKPTFATRFQPLLSHRKSLSNWKSLTASLQRRLFARIGSDRYQSWLARVLDDFSRRVLVYFWSEIASTNIAT